MGLTMWRWLAPLLLLSLCACGKPPDCAETLSVKLAAIRAFGEYPTEAQIKGVLGEQSDGGVATGAIVQKYGESGCSDVVAVLYPHSSGYIVALGRENTDWSNFPGVGDALQKM